MYLALARGRPEEALRLLGDENPSWRSIPLYQVQFHTQKGLALAGVGRLPEAAVSLWQAVQGIESLRQKVTGERTGFLQAGDMAAISGPIGDWCRSWPGWP